MAHPCLYDIAALYIHSQGRPYDWPLPNPCERQPWRPTALSAGFSAFYSHPHRRWSATKLEPAGSGKCEETLELEAIKVLKAIMPEAAEYVRGLEERAEHLEIEPDLKSVEEYRTIMDDAWSSYVRGATWRGR